MKFESSHLCLKFTDYLVGIPDDIENIFSRIFFMSRTIDSFYRRTEGQVPPPPAPEKRPARAVIQYMDLHGRPTKLSHGKIVRIQADSDGSRRYQVLRNHRPGDRHLYLECLTTNLESTDKRPLRCKFRQRSDRLVVNESTGTHTCEFAIAETLSGFCLSDENVEFSEQLAYLGGKLNLSLESTISATMYHFAEHIFHLGQKNPRSSFDKICPWPSRYELRGAMISVSLKATEAAVRQFRHSPYLSVALDEGSTLGTKYVHFILHDVHRGMGEYCVTSEILNGTGTAEDYVESLHNGFMELTKHEVRISTVVVDGGTAQLKALGPKPGMLRTKFPLKGHLGEMRKLIVFPCICHKLNNCYKALHQKCAVFAEFTQDLRAMSETLRASSQLHCPQFVSTRWLYDASIMKWLQEHKTDVERLRPGENTVLLYQRIALWEFLVYSTRSLIDQLECSNAPIADVWPKVYTLVSDIRSAAREHQEKAVKTGYREFASVLEKQVLLNGSYIIAFMLTPIGRDWFRYPEPWRVTPVQNCYSFGKTSLTTETDDLPATNAVVDEIADPDRIRLLLSSTEGLEQRRSRAVLADDSETNSEEEEEEAVEEEEEATDPQDSDSVSIVENDTTNQNPQEALTDNAEVVAARPQLRPGQWKTAALEEWMSMARTVFGKLANGKDRVQRAYDQINTYLSTSNKTVYESSLSQVQGVNLWNWENLETDDRFLEIAEIALRIRPTPASEASAERFISLQRLVILARRNRANKDLTDARMALLKRLDDLQDSYVPIDVEATRSRIDVGVFRVPRS